MICTWGQATHTGLVRGHNEDALLVEPELGLFAVADGMGGHRAGEVASRLAVDVLAAVMKEKQDVILPDRLLLAAETANREIYSLGRANPQLSGMGTTLTAACLYYPRLFFVHIGDSRLYLWRRGTLQQLSRDHTLVQEMVDQALLTPRQAEQHPRRNVLLRALGTAALVQLDCGMYEVGRGDRLLICSDGLFSDLGQQGLSDVLAAIADPQRVADCLLERALAAGGSDNISVIVVDIYGHG
ncbi:MAG: Stp1/IreP family PP2C-type Ser/Thr phosphatase [Desulfurispora sp.]|uniref:Stp1/IreP family PP2C-type Ser/Thr phosphatase n=1 Tax=Desulfurispora sp. TaxID=3014275 RepID=UPI00404B5148